MPLKKYNTSSAILASTSASSFTSTGQQLTIKPPQSHQHQQQSSQPVNSNSSTSSSPSPNSQCAANTSTSSSNSSGNGSNNNSVNASQHNNQPHGSPTTLKSAQISSFNDLLPNIIESIALPPSITSQDKSGKDDPLSNNAASTYCSLIDSSGAMSMPPELKSKLYLIFNQIEKEFDSLYAQNFKLKQQLLSLNANNKLVDNEESLKYPLNNNSSINTNTSSTSTLVAGGATTLTTPQASSNLTKTQNQNEMNLSTSSNDSSPKSINPNGLAKQQAAANGNVNNQRPLSILPTQTNQMQTNAAQTITTALTHTASTAKSAILSSKTRINNLSFPKFRPNAKEFIMQSIKNTSQQIVNKTQNHHNSSMYSSKLQCNLAGHKDGIWDINCISIPQHLLNSSNASSYSSNNINNAFNYNLLVGTASADTTARLWYFNSHLNSNTIAQSSSANMSPTIVANNSSQQQTITTAFCIQEYCGHAGSVNSIRFHPRFFTDATNLILTASGDCQAHIWQCVLSPLSDSLESTSEVVLNYNNCYSFAMNNFQTNTNGISSPPSNGLNSYTQSPSSQLMNGNTGLNGVNSHYQDLISNTAIIRSPIKRYEGHSDACIAAEWFPDGELLATASWDRTANVYNVETGKILCNLQHDDYLTNVSIHRIHKMILTSSKDTTFKVWDFRDPICSVNVYQGHNRSVNSAIFIGDDKIATSSDDQTLKLWDLRIMRSPVCTINVNSGVNRICAMMPNFDTNGSVTSSETYLCLPLDNRDIKIYNLQGERILRLPRNDRVGHRRLVTSLASHGNMLFSASFDKSINCWSFDLNLPVAKSSSNKLANQLNNKENNSLNHNANSVNEHNMNIQPTSANSNELASSSFGFMNTQVPMSSNKNNHESSWTNTNNNNNNNASYSPPPVYQQQTSSSSTNFVSSPLSANSGISSSITSSQAQQQPLNAISQNNSSSSSSSNSNNLKGITTLTKLINERIKI